MNERGVRKGGEVVEVIQNSHCPHAFTPQNDLLDLEVNMNELEDGMEVVDFVDSERNVLSLGVAAA